MRFLYLALLCFAVFTCSKKSNNLDLFFDQLEGAAPQEALEGFKSAPFDSAVINNNQYSVIFDSSAREVFKNPNQRRAFESFFEEQNLPLEGEHMKWTIVGAFHHKLNHREYDFRELESEMKKQLNKYKEKKFPKKPEN